MQVAAKDIPAFIGGVADMSQDQRGDMWRYCLDYRNALGELMGGTLQAQQLAVMRLLARVAAGFASERRAEEVEDFFRGVFGPQLPQYAVEAVEAIRANAAARGNVIRDTCTWLQYNFEQYLAEDELGGDYAGDYVGDYVQIFDYVEDATQDYGYDYFL